MDRTEDRVLHITSPLTSLPGVDILGVSICGSRPGQLVVDGLFPINRQEPTICIDGRRERDGQLTLQFPAMGSASI